MNDDLISRKAVIALIDELGYINVSNHNDFKENCRVDKIRQEVVELPTAFDKEKVKQELEISSKLYSLNDRDCEFAIPQNIALEIVEKGGIE